MFLRVPTAERRKGREGNSVTLVEAGRRQRQQRADRKETRTDMRDRGSVGERAETWHFFIESTHGTHQDTRNAMQCKQSTHQQQQQVIERGKKGRGKEKKKKSTQRENVESGEGRRGERREQAARERPRKKEIKHEPTTSAGRGVRRTGRPIFSPFSAEDEKPNPETTHERRETSHKPTTKKSCWVPCSFFLFPSPFSRSLIAWPRRFLFLLSSFFFLLPACSSPFVCGTTTD